MEGQEFKDSLRHLGNSYLKGQERVWEIIQYHFRLQGAPQDTGSWTPSLGVPFFLGGTRLQ